MVPPTPVPNTLSSGMFIKTPGSFHFGDRSSTHHIDVTQTGQDIGWTISRSISLPHGGTSGGSGGGGMQTKAPDDPWFIFVQSPGSYWLCNGSDRLDYHLSDEHGSNAGPAVDSGKLLPSCPKVPLELIPHLPPELQKLFPPVEMPQKRPSI